MMRTGLQSWLGHAWCKKRYCRLMELWSSRRNFLSKFLILFLINQTFWDRKTELNTNIKPRLRSHRSLRWRKAGKVIWGEFGLVWIFSMIRKMGDGLLSNVVDKRGRVKTGSDSDYRAEN